MVSFERIPEMFGSVPARIDIASGYDASEEETGREYVSRKEAAQGFLCKDIVEKGIQRIKLPPCESDLAEFAELLALAE